MLATVSSPCVLVERFPLGCLYITPGAETKLAELHLNPHGFLARHASGDWGNLGAREKRANEYARRHAHCLYSAYHLSDEDQLWVITAADRSATYLLLPDEA